MRSGRKTILLVEDEALIAMMEARTLEDEGYAVIQAARGEMAVETVRSDTGGIDLILMDINLGPGMDGTQAAREILTMRDIPVVFLSSHTEKEIVEKTESITSYGYVVKNSGATVLLAAIRMAFRLYEAHARLSAKSMEIEAVNEELNATVEEMEAANEELTRMSEELLDRETMLAQSEEKYRSLFDNMMDGFALHEIILDEIGRPADYRFLALNVAFERLTGLRAEALTGRTVREALPGTEQVWIERYGRVALTGAVDKFESYSRQLDRWYSVTAYSPRKGQFAVIFEDATERIRATESLRASESRFRALLSSVSDYIYTVTCEAGTPVGTVHGPGCFSVTGFGQEDYAADPYLWYRMVHPDDRDAVTGLGERVMAGAESPWVEHRILHRDGSVRWVRNTATLVRDAQGRVCGYDGLIADITARKEIETALRESEAQKQAILDGITTNIAFVNPNLEIIWANRTAAESVHTVPEKMRGHTCHSFWADPAMPCAGCPTIEALKSQKTERTEIRTPDGRYWEESAEPVFDADGTILGVVEIALDITGRKAALAQLTRKMTENEAMLRASRAVLEQRDFAAAARTIFDICKDLTGASAGYVALLAPGGEENEVLFLDSGGRSCSVDPKLPMPIRGLRAVAYREKKAVYDNSFHDGPWMEFMPSGHVRLDNVMFAPLVIENNAVGLIGLANRAGGFNDEDRRIVTAFAGIAAISLMNSRNLATLHSSVRERETLMRELQHRVKNNLGIIESLLSMEMNSMDDGDMREVLRKAISRIQSMSRIYQQLYGTPGIGHVDLKRYIGDIARRLFDAYSIHPDRVTLALELDDAELDLKRAVPLGLILNELVSNALKYAFPGERRGILRIALERSDGVIALSVADDGVGMHAGESPGRLKGLGTQLVGLLAQQIGGGITITGERGTEARVCFPAESEKSAAGLTANRAQG